MCVLPLRIKLPSTLQASGIGVLQTNSHWRSIALCQCVRGTAHSALTMRRSGACSRRARLHQGLWRLGRPLQPQARRCCSARAPLLRTPMLTVAVGSYIELQVLPTCSSCPMQVLPYSRRWWSENRRPWQQGTNAFGVQLLPETHSALHG